MRTLLDVKWRGRTELGCSNCKHYRPTKTYCKKLMLVTNKYFTCKALALGPRHS
jgi:hypothetical protein